MLIAVLTLITTSYLAINLLSGPESPDTDAPETPDTPEVNDSTENSSGNETSPEETGSGEDSEEEPEGLLGKSIYGFQMMFSDMQEALELLSD